LPAIVIEKVVRTNSWCACCGEADIQTQYISISHNGEKRYILPKHLLEWLKNPDESVLVLDKLKHDIEVGETV
jgi:hypothetical protein